MLVCHYCQHVVQIVDSLNEDGGVAVERDKSKMKQLLLFAKAADSRPKSDDSDEEMLDTDQRPSEEIANWLGIDKSNAVQDRPS